MSSTVISVKKNLVEKVPEKNVPCEFKPEGAVKTSEQPMINLPVLTMSREEPVRVKWYMDNLKFENLDLEVKENLILKTCNPTHKVDLTANYSVHVPDGNATFEFKELSHDLSKKKVNRYALREHNCDTEFPVTLLETVFNSVYNTSMPGNPEMLHTIMFEFETLLQILDPCRNSEPAILREMLSKTADSYTYIKRQLCFCFTIDHELYLKLCRFDLSFKRISKKEIIDTSKLLGFEDFVSDEYLFDYIENVLLDECEFEKKEENQIEKYEFKEDQWFEKGRSSISSIQLDDNFVLEMTKLLPRTVKPSKKCNEKSSRQSNSESNLDIKAIYSTVTEKKGDKTNFKNLKRNKNREVKFNEDVSRPTTVTTKEEIAESMPIDRKIEKNLKEKFQNLFKKKRKMMVSENFLESAFDTPNAVATKPPSNIAVPNKEVHKNSKCTSRKKRTKSKFKYAFESTSDATRPPTIALVPINQKAEKDSKTDSRLAFKNLFRKKKKKVEFNDTVLKCRFDLRAAFKAVEPKVTQKLSHSNNFRTNTGPILKAPTTTFKTIEDISEPSVAASAGLRTSIFKLRGRKLFK